MVLSKVANSEAHRKSVALMRFLSSVASNLGQDVASNTYVVGGAIRDFVLDRPIKDVDVVIDSVTLGKDSTWFAEQVASAIPAATSIAINNYGVAILTVSKEWVLEGLDMKGEVIEVANARTESYTEGGYKPTDVAPSTIQEDVLRRELTYNTLLISLLNLANGPDKADILDLTGCGMKDLMEGRMQCPSSPDVTFKDDPSRMIRVIKFAIRYRHELTPDTRDAILRNADKIRNIPLGHLASLLTDIVLKEESWLEAMNWMKELGLLTHIRELIKEDQVLKTTIIGHLHDHKLDMLFGLMDLDLSVGDKVSFLTEEEKVRLREIASGMESGKAWRFVNLLKNPGAALKDKGFFPRMVRQYGGGNFKVFNETIYSPSSRKLLLDNPDLAYRPERFRSELEKAIQVAAA